MNPPKSYPSYFGWRSSKSFKNVCFLVLAAENGMTEFEAVNGSHVASGAWTLAPAAPPRRRFAHLRKIREQRKSEDAQALVGLPQRWHVTASNLSALRLGLRADLHPSHAKCASGTPSLRRKEGIALAHLYGRAEARALTLVWMVDAMGRRE
jgi:hypothetical protein